MTKPIAVYLDGGKKWVFACAIDWPGWCLRGRSDQEAVDALLAYTGRYQSSVGHGFTAKDVDVVGRVEGGANVDFGALGQGGPWDDQPVSRKEAQRQLTLLDAAWKSFDRTVGLAPASLRKGPRGGGRDTAKIVDHVRDAERAYSHRLGAKVAPRTPWPEQRRMILDTLADHPEGAKWPFRYAVRRVAWHVLDHQWEIEDRIDP